MYYTESYSFQCIFDFENVLYNTRKSEHHFGPSGLLFSPSQPSNVENLSL